MNEYVGDIHEKDLLSMKEFSTFTGVEPSTLRYWDEIGLFSPAKRNPETGYRYYAPMQIVTVHFVTTLSALGVPLKRFSHLTSERTPETILKLLEEHENILDVKMRHLRESYSIIHARRNLIRLGLDVKESDIYVCALKNMPIILGPPNDFAGDASFYKAFLNFCKQAKPLRINLSHPIGGYWDSMDTFLRNPSQPTRFFVADPTGYEKRSAGKYLVGHTRGYYGSGMGELSERMKLYAEEHSLSFSGHVYALYLHDELSVADPEQYLARVIAGVSGKIRG
jgi:DNA-binding transcriptional MerR regulator